MTTLSSSLTVRKTDLYNRKIIFDNQYGIQFDGDLTLKDCQITEELTLEINNFLLISTDTPLLMTISQDTIFVDPISGNTSKNTQKITTRISGIFLSYANLGKVILRCDPAVQRVPKTSLIYS